MTMFTAVEVNETLASFVNMTRRNRPDLSSSQKMVKCPRGTSSQVKANLAHAQKPSTFSFDSNFFSWVYDPVKGQMVYVGEKESQGSGTEASESELDSNRADKRAPPTPKDELVYFFVGCLLEVLVDSWEGKPCVKRKTVGPKDFSPPQSAESGWSLGPCDNSSGSLTTDHIKDLYQKRSSNLSKRNLGNDKRSDSNDSEYLLEEEDRESSGAPDWKAFVPDEDVHFVLTNGAWYRGRVSRRLMEGEGVYFWEDGSTFKGEFQGGCATGTGQLEFPDLSVYEGGVYKAFRHGEGMHCFSDSPVMYSGQWWLGQRHGHGLIVYDDPSKCTNFYQGQWQNDFKEGFGFRQYPFGGRYVGFWSNGKRHGRGVMIWSNRDIYRGEWKDGLMHGYGEYTWNGFLNKSLSYPATNTYRGYWSEGKRNGTGIFEAKNGTFIETIWVDNMKEGPGAVVCCNGQVVAAECLFQNDQQALLSDKENKTGLLLRNQSHCKKKSPKKEEHLLAYLSSVERARAVSIPIHASVHSINLSPHAVKFSDKIKEKLIKEIYAKAPCPSFQAKQNQLEQQVERCCEESAMSIPDEEQCQLSKCMMQEEKNLRNSVVANISALKACYDYYATLACEKPPPFKCVLLRMFFWQMLIDGEIFNHGISLVDIDTLLAKEDYLLIGNPHDPFERIQFWQFLHTLLVLSWHLYGSRIFEENPLIEDENVNNFLSYYQESERKSVLKAAFEYFLEKDIFLERFRGGHFQPDRGKFQESDLAPMEAMYKVYRSIGEPHKARELVSAICGNRETTVMPPIVEYFEKLPFYKIEGKNAFAVGGELIHLPEPPPFNYPELIQLEERNFFTEELTWFKTLKPSKVIRCLVATCPGIMAEEFIVNMEYQLTFLEFYKVIILCTELILKMKKQKEIRNDIIAQYKLEMEEYEKQMIAFERTKESSGTSRKKSRQHSDLSKKAKK